MSGEMDALTFMEKNGRGFFDSECRQVSDQGEMMEITVSIPVSRLQLREIHRRTRREGVTIEEFLMDIVERFLNDQ